jgi:DNA repair protein RadC
MLFVQDQDGQYSPAPEKLVLTEANRLSGYRLRRGTMIASSDAAKSVIGYKLRDKQNEIFACLFLDSGHRVLAFKEMFQGSINKATVHPREVVKEALQSNAAAIIFAHNHPSGDSKPSDQDIALTEILKKILNIIDVRVLDHLVIGEEIFSFADQGLLNKNSGDT